VKRTIASIALLTLTLAIVLTAGCPASSGGALEVGAVNHPDITADGAGGAYAVYQVYLSSTEVNQFYLQRLSPEGALLWGEKGVLIGEAEGKLDVDALGVMADDSGDALAAWCDWWNDVMCITKVNSQGEILWQEAINGLKYASHIVSDGAGGIIYIVNDRGMQRRDAEGNLVWDKPDYLVEEPNAWRNIVSDGSGGAFVLTIGRDDDYGSLILQRINGQGNCPWSQEAVTLYSGSQEGLGHIAADGTGGAFIVWAKRDPAASGFPEYLMSVLRLGGDGEVIWEKPGFPGELVGYDIFVVADDDGNALVFWEYSVGLGAQKLSPDGGLLWGGDKRYELDGFSYNVVATGGGGAIIGACSMYDGRSLTAQIVDEYGRALFAEAVAVSDDDQVHSWRFMMAADEEGGAFFAWGSSQNVYSVERSSVQRLSADGERLWGDSGIRLDDWN
jgi:hypothetical protein